MKPSILALLLLCGACNHDPGQPALDGAPPDAPGPDTFAGPDGAAPPGERQQLGDAGVTWRELGAVLPYPGRFTALKLTYGGTAGGAVLSGGSTTIEGDQLTVKTWTLPGGSKSCTVTLPPAVVTNLLLVASTVNWVTVASSYIPGIPKTCGTEGSSGTLSIELTQAAGPPVVAATEWCVSNGPPAPGLALSVPADLAAFLKVLGQLTLGICQTP